MGTGVFSLSAYCEAVDLLHDIARPPPRDPTPRLLEGEDDELVLFADHDTHLGRGDGFYAHDEQECASRRVDLRTSLDKVNRPVPMDEASESDEAVVLDLSP